MIIWRPDGEEKPIKNVVNVSPVGPPLDRNNVVLEEIVPGKTCIYPFIPKNANYEVIFFKQKYKVKFLPYEENPWKEFLEYLEFFVDESLDQGFRILLNTPGKTQYVFKFLKKKFPARIDVTKIDINQNEISLGSSPQKVLRFGLHSWGQKSFIRALWKLSLGYIDQLEIFLVNRPIDNLIINTENPMVAFKYIAREDDFHVSHPLIPRMEDNFFKITLNGQERIIRDPTKSFDVEIYPIIVEKNNKAVIKGFRILGTHIASFLRFYILEAKKAIDSVKIWARDWKNSRINIKKITDVPPPRDKEFREAVVLFEGEVPADVPLTKINYPENMGYPKVEEFEIHLDTSLQDFIENFDINNPEKYSSRYSYILPKVRGNWDLAIQVSRALKCKIMKKVTLHTINHAIVSLTNFYGYLACENLEIPEKLSIDKRFYSQIGGIEELFEIVYELFKGCTCDEVCEGCAYNPSCPHENRYLDRIIALKSLEKILKE